MRDIPYGSHAHRSHADERHAEVSIRRIVLYYSQRIYHVLRKVASAIHLGGLGALCNSFEYWGSFVGNWNDTAAKSGLWRWLALVIWRKDRGAAYYLT